MNLIHQRMPVFLLLMLCFCILSAGTGKHVILADAAAAKSQTVASGAKPAVITDCKIRNSKYIRVTAQLSDPSIVQGKKCWLFALGMAETKLSASAKPVASAKKAKKMIFSVKLNQNSSNSHLSSGFVLASRDAHGTYQIISNRRFVSNPNKLAKYTYKFPTAVSKKGLQTSASMLEDAAELNVRNAALNIVFTEMIASRGEQNQRLSIPYKYHGKTYWFRKSLISSYDRQLTALKETKSVNSAILLLGWRSDLTHLIYPSGRKSGHSFYAWNTSDTAAREQLEAALSFLASRYSPSNGKYGRIVNWIVGNEVNNYQVYNYAGKKTLKQYAAIYASAFRMTYNTVTSVYSNARVYISLDHLWNTNSVPGTYPARKMLDSFAASLKSTGNINWNLAYHPYSSPLTEPRFWANKNGQLTQSLTSPVINMGNISLLTDYIRSTYGSNTRIILSEQGYTSRQNRKNTEALQAAAIAYSYYLTESNDMIDSFIMNRHVDHEVEVAQGLNLGLWTTGGSSLPEWAADKKLSWNVFKYMDTNQSKKVTAFAPAKIGVDSWSELVPGYSKSLYTKSTIQTGKLNIVSKYKKTASVPASWKKYGGASRILTTGPNARSVIRDNSRNQNCLWGFTQNFGKIGLKLGSSPSFYTTLRVNGATKNKVLVKLRFHSGNQIFECSQNISAGKIVRLGVSLKNWEYRNKITKIQILVLPTDKGGWKSNASMEMALPVRGR